jgi:integrase
LPDLITADLLAHLDDYAAPGPDGFVLVGVRGGQLRRSNFSTPWAKALAEAGLPTGTHIHDLRHTGNTFPAETGASLAELMNRMGHASTRAAQIYLHARKERDREIATTLDRMAKRELKKARKRKPDAPERPTGT